MYLRCMGFHEHGQLCMPQSGSSTGIRRSAGTFSQQNPVVICIFKANTNAKQQKVSWYLTVSKLRHLAKGLH